MPLREISAISIRGQPARVGGDMAQGSMATANLYTQECAQVRVLPVGKEDFDPFFRLVSKGR